MIYPVNITLTGMHSETLDGVLNGVDRLDMMWYGMLTGHSIYIVGQSSAGYLGMLGSCNATNMAK
jgi:hypothetical protein